MQGTKEKEKPPGVHVVCSGISTNEVALLEPGKSEDGKQSGGQGRRGEDGELEIVTRHAGARETESDVGKDPQRLDSQTMEPGSPGNPTRENVGRKSRGSQFGVHRHQGRERSGALEARMDGWGQETRRRRVEALSEPLESLKLRTHFSPFLLDLLLLLGCFICLLTKKHLVFITGKFYY